MGYRLLIIAALGFLGAAHQPAAAQADLRLAQNREIEVYYDEYGRRVIADAWTGEIIAIERPRGRVDGRRTGALPRYEDGEERYYLDEMPNDGWRRRDDYAREPYPEDREPLYDEDYSAYPQDRDVYREEAFPAAPLAPGRRDDGSVTRQPLPQPDTASRQPSAQPQPGALPPAQETVSAPLPDPAPDATTQPLSPADPMASPSIGAKAYVEVAELQVLLDRTGASPGVIDGHMGDNVSKALEAYRSLTGRTLRTTDRAAIEEGLAATGGDAFFDYTISAEDAAGPYVASIPADYGEKAQLDRMSYTSTLEMLAERFHMSEAWLKQMNPNANFNRAGTVIRVARVGEPATGEVSRIIADKGRKQVRAYNADGKLVAAYPATIGSSDTPSPTGTHTVERIALDPEYTYNPKLNFKQGQNDKILRIPPGPNGPVGSVWIALSKPTYGIHGTPDPSKIGKTESHGCVRLTNWDAQELAKLVKQGVTVQFME